MTNSMNNFIKSIGSIEGKAVKVINALSAKKVYLEDLDEKGLCIIIIREGYMMDYTNDYKTLQNDKGIFRYAKINNAFLIEAQDSNSVGFTDEEVVRNLQLQEHCIIREIYGEDAAKDLEYNILLSAIEEDITSSINSDKIRIEREIATLKDSRKECIQQLFNIAKRIDEKCSQLNQDKVIKEITEKIMKEFLKIQQHKSVERLYMEDSFVNIETKDVYMMEHFTKRRYYLGRMIIKIQINNGVIRIDNINNKRQGYWQCPAAHPHVNGSGEPCLGTASSQFVAFWTDKEYYAAFITMLNYLQCVDITDPAGVYICAWDEVDGDGNITHCGHEPDSDEYGDDTYWDSEMEGERCSECGDILDENDAFRCEECNQIVCGDEDCMESDENICLCHSCFERYYARCDECNKILRIGELVERDGTLICRDCYDKRAPEENIDEIFDAVFVALPTLF